MLKGKNISIDSDPDRNAAADEVISLLRRGREEIVPDLLKKAGKALANRFFFAIDAEGLAAGEGLIVQVCPIYFFKREGYPQETACPIDHLLPGCVKAITEEEAYYKFTDPAMKTPLDAALYLQQLGFIWNRKLQDFVDETLTDELKVLHTSSAFNAPVAPAVKKPQTPKP